MFGLGWTEMAIILGIALIVLGPTKLPELARSLGKGIREFRKATEDFKSTIEDEVHKPEPKQPKLQSPKAREAVAEEQHEEDPHEELVVKPSPQSVPQGAAAEPSPAEAEVEAEAPAHAEAKTEASAESEPEAEPTAQASPEPAAAPLDPNPSTDPKTTA